jgi:hypothetical protein
MTDGRPIQARKFLFLLIMSGNSVRVGTASFFGPPSPLRLSQESSASYVPLAVDGSGWAVVVADASLLRTLAAAKSVKVLHGQGATGEIAFLYDFSRIANVLRIGQMLCGKKG